MPASGARRPRDASGPWYAEGLRFECQPDCGRCCTQHGTYSYVYLESDDVERLASHLGLTAPDFRKRLTRREGRNTVLLMRGSSCPFLDGTRCGVYEARPKQCRTFPFWPDLVATRRQWRALERFCPGIGRGQVIPLDEIRRQLAAAGKDP